MEGISLHCCPVCGSPGGRCSRQPVLVQPEPCWTEAEDGLEHGHLQEVTAAVKHISQGEDW